MALSIRGSAGASSDCSSTESDTQTEPALADTVPNDTIESGSIVPWSAKIASLRTRPPAVSQDVIHFEKGPGFFGAIGQFFMDLGGRMVGALEISGLRYSVTPYATQVPGTPLTRGSRISSAEVTSLKAEGYRGVINFCAENNDDHAAAKKAGLHQLHLEITDNTSPTRRQCEDFLKFVTNPQNQPLYMHCEAGQGRTGVMMAVYRMAVQGWTPEEALEEALHFKSKEGVSLPVRMPNQRSFIERFGPLAARWRAAGTLFASPKMPSATPEIAS